MEYSPEEFFRLTQLVEDQGGELLDKQCLGERYKFTGHVGKGKSVYLARCGNSGTTFEVPYEDPNGTMRPVELCAVCDDLGQMPRFKAAMQG